ncbi:hypothetical protein Droror1_Dr00023237, partial [Drosera rotundifolia]
MPLDCLNSSSVVNQQGTTCSFENSASNPSFDPTQTPNSNHSTCKTSANLNTAPTP